MRRRKMDSQLAHPDSEAQQELHLVLVGLENVGHPESVGTRRKARIAQLRPDAQPTRLRLAAQPDREANLRSPIHQRIRARKDGPAATYGVPGIRRGNL